MAYEGRYAGWSRDELIRELYRKEGEVLRFKKENLELSMKSNDLQFRIEHELEPRIEAERRAYDKFIKNAERGQHERGRFLRHGCRRILRNKGLP